MKNKVMSLAIVLSLTMLFSACSGKQELKLGTYVSDLDSFISLRLQSENKFQLNGPAEISSIAMGTYSIKNGSLILTANDKEEYIFSIENDKLIFESGTWFENWVEQGTEFYLSDE